MFNCSSLVRESQDLSITAPDSSSNLILEGSLIPFNLSTSVVKSESSVGSSKDYSC
jgi:hypothetical protein